MAERFVNYKIIEMTEIEFVHYQSTIISHVDSEQGGGHILTRLCIMMIGLEVLRNRLR